MPRRSSVKSLGTATTFSRITASKRSPRSARNRAKALDCKISFCRRSSALMGLPDPPPSGAHHQINAPNPWHMAKDFFHQSLSQKTRCTRNKKNLVVQKWNNDTHKKTPASREKMKTQLREKSLSKVVLIKGVHWTCVNLFLAQFADANPY